MVGFRVMNSVVFVQISTGRCRACSFGIFVVAAIRSTSGCCPDNTNITLGADATGYDPLLPQHATEADRCSICSNRLVPVLPRLVFAVGHATDYVDPGTTWSWADSLSERLCLDSKFNISHFQEFLFCTPCVMLAVCSSYIFGSSAVSVRSLHYDWLPILNLLALRVLF